MEIETIYKFKDIPGLHADSKGDFFYNGHPARKVYRANVRWTFEPACV